MFSSLLKPTNTALSFCYCSACLFWFGWCYGGWLALWFFSCMTGGLQSFIPQRAEVTLGFVSGGFLIVGEFTTVTIVVGIFQHNFFPAQNDLFPCQLVTNLWRTTLYGSHSRNYCYLLAVLAHYQNNNTRSCCSRRSCSNYHLCNWRHNGIGLCYFKLL